MLLQTKKCKSVQENTNSSHSLHFFFKMFKRRYDFLMETILKLGNI